MISTRGRYALRVMIDLAKNGSGDFIPMKDVADRQGISLKYLESIMSLLAKNRLVEGASGKGGGYHLVRNPDEYTLLEILKVTEGGIEPVACGAVEGEGCDKLKECATYPVWKELSELINDFLANKTLKDLLG